jgi:hypothetical protein
MASHPIRFGIQTGQECVDTVERDPGGAGTGVVSDPERPTAPSPAPGGAGTLAGACPCGAVRFEIGAVFDCRYCHCRDCRRSTGAPVTVGAVVKPGDFQLTAGALTTVHRGAKGSERRCGSCRTEVAFEFETSLGPLLSVPVGLLDDPDACPPRFHQWFSQRLRWMHVHDALPKYADDRIPHPGARAQVADTGRPRNG